nr:hypothetical protein JVH1_0961 [Rhodococcus sp. JVH1]
MSTLSIGSIRDRVKRSALCPASAVSRRACGAGSTVFSENLHDLNDSLSIAVR